MLFMLKTGILLLLIAICFNCQTIRKDYHIIDKKNIEKYLSLNASFDREVVLINDTVKIKIEFINHSNDTVIFFPVSHTYLFKPSNYFSGQNSLALNLTRDLRKKVLLRPNENHILNYRLEVDSLFFNPGINDSLYVSYSFKSDHIKQEVPKNILQGSLISKPLIIEVKVN